MTFSLFAWHIIHKAQKVKLKPTLKLPKKLRRSTGILDVGL